MAREVTGRVGGNRRQGIKSGVWALLVIHRDFSQQHQSPKSLSSSPSFQRSHPPAPGLRRIGSGSFPAFHTGKEQYATAPVY